MKTMTVTPEIQHNIATLFAENATLKEIVAKQGEMLVKLEALVKWYEGQNLLLKRRQFGASSECSDIDYRQLTLLGETVVPEPPPEIEEVTIKRKKRVGKRKEDLSNLPVIRVDHELPENERNCPDCDSPMRDIGIKVRKEIEIIPAQAIVKEP
jgi:hypothetical protein